MGDSVVTRSAQTTEIPTTSSYRFNRQVLTVRKMLCFNQKQKLPQYWNCWGAMGAGKNCLDIEEKLVPTSSVGFWKTTHI